MLVWLYVEPRTNPVVSMETEVNGTAEGSTGGQRLEVMTAGETHTHSVKLGMKV